MILKLYIRILAVFYFIGFLFHLFDLVGLRLNFQNMSLTWKSWTIYLLCADFFAAIGLWFRTKWGISLFFIIATSQLIAYVEFPQIFGNQMFLIGFHIISLSLFITLNLVKMRR